MLTNFTTIYKRLQRLKELEAMEATGATEVLPKKEVLRLGHEREKLERNLGGIRDMTRLPAAVWVVDTRKEHIAVTEARKLGIPVVAILDTNCDPDEVDYPIPGNDDAIRAGSLLTRIVADAVAEGLRLRSVYASEAAGKEGAAVSASPADEEPLAEWERELLESESGDAAGAGRFGGTGDAAASASADKPAATGRSGQGTGARSGQGAGGARGGTQSRSGSRGATPAKSGAAADRPTSASGSSRSRASTGRSTEATAASTDADTTAPADADTTVPADTAAAGDAQATSSEGAGDAQASSPEPEPEPEPEADAQAASSEAEGGAGAEADQAQAGDSGTADASQEGETPAEAAEVAADPTNETRSPRV
jgi:hypothetical protein